jgi:hypothetical protein
MLGFPLAIITLAKGVVDVVVWDHTSSALPFGP